MKTITFPIRLIVRALVLPIKVLFATTGLTFRAGLKVGALPVRGGVVAGRKLGAKTLFLLALGIAIGVVLGQRQSTNGAGKIATVANQRVDSIENQLGIVARPVDPEQPS